MKLLVWIFIFGVTLLGVAGPAAAVQTATINRVVEEKQLETAGVVHLWQRLEVTIGDQKTQLINGEVPAVNLQRYREGQKVLVEMREGGYVILDYDRSESLKLLLVIFIVLVLVVGGWQGGASLLGLALSFGVVIKVLLPAIMEGKDPLLWSIISSILILPISFFLSHGFNRKTVVALLGTTITLAISGLLTIGFAQGANLTGYASEESGFVGGMMGKMIDMRGLLMAGMILGLVGVIDDVTVSQAAMVFQMKELAHNLKPGELFLRAMRVGRDHLASMINTLILVYAAASIPLLMLFVGAQRSWLELVNLEMVAEEIIRMLVGSIGVLVSVPMTTFLAVVLAPKKNMKTNSKVVESVDAR